jgi:hypothetical protein
VAFGPTTWFEGFTQSHLKFECQSGIDDSAANSIVQPESNYMSTIARHLGKEFGYSCQPWLSIDIADRYFSSVYRAWFATSINPQLNGGSSNPLTLFRELDQIVHSNDFNHSRVDQLKSRLSRWIAGSTLASQDVANLLSEIAAAPMPALRPCLWKLNLQNIHVSRLISLGQYPDEYQVRDLIKSEIEVLVP